MSHTPPRGINRQHEPEIAQPCTYFILTVERRPGGRTDFSHEGEGQKLQTLNLPPAASVLLFHSHSFVVFSPWTHVETHHVSLFSALAAAPPSDVPDNSLFLLPTSPFKKKLKNHIKVAEEKRCTQLDEFPPSPSPARTRSNPAGRVLSSAKTIPDMLFVGADVCLRAAEGTVVAYIFSRNSRVLFLKRQNKSVNMSPDTAAVPHIGGWAQTAAAAAVTPQPPRRLQLGSMILYFVSLSQTLHNT